MLPLVATQRGSPGPGSTRSEEPQRPLVQVRHRREQGPAGEAPVAASGLASAGSPGRISSRCRACAGRRRGGAPGARCAGQLPHGPLVGVLATDGDPSLKIDLPEGADPVTLAGNASFRRNLKHRLRRAMEEYDVACGASTKPILRLSRPSSTSRGAAGRASRKPPRLQRRDRDFYAAWRGEHRSMATVHLLPRVQTAFCSRASWLSHNCVTTCRKVRTTRRLPLLAGPPHPARHHRGPRRGRSRSCRFLGLAAPWKADWIPEVLRHSTCLVYGKGLRGRMLRFWRSSSSPPPVPRRGNGSSRRLRLR